MRTKSDIYTMLGFRAFSCSEHNGHRFGFNGQEKDDEVHNVSGSSYDFGLRMYDPRVARFSKRDPFERVIFNQSTYVFAGDNPVKFIDFEGGFRIEPEIAQKYPVLVNTLNRISSLVETDDANVMRDNPLLRAIATAAGLEGSNRSQLTKLQRVFKNGQGPWIGEVINSDNVPLDAVAVDKQGSQNKFLDEHEVKIRPELLLAAQGLEMPRKSDFLKANPDVNLGEWNAISAQFSLFITLLHEGVHVLADVYTEGEQKGEERGDLFESLAFPEKFMRNTEELLTNPIPIRIASLSSPGASFRASIPNVNRYLNPAVSPSSISPIKNRYKGKRRGLGRRKKQMSKNRGRYRNVRHL